MDLLKHIDSISQNVPIPEKEYMGMDGLLRCAVCHKPTQHRASVPALGLNKIVRCICDCEKAKLDAKEAEAKAIERDKMRRVCFEQAKMHEWTFQNDDRKNERLSDAMKRYAEQFRDFKKESKGLLLYGPTGTGKTYFAACIANFLIDKDVPVLMTNFNRLTNQIQGKFEGKQEFIDSLNRYSLLIIDDLGIERGTEFMQEQVYAIIDGRYRSGLPLIITTNLTAEELKKPQEIGKSRIYDRILEHCHPIEVKGGSRRRQHLRDTFADTQMKLGL